jgi:hypothetical protein
MPLKSPLRRPHRWWRSPNVWVPAPRDVVDPRSAGVDPDSLSMPAALDRFAAPPVFICGSARSGTTWTYDLFDRHPEVCGICESWILSQTHGVTSVLTQDYWNVAAREAWRERVDVPFGAVQLVGYDAVVRDIGELVARWFVQAARPEHRVLVAKEPLDVAAAAILFPEARFIHVVRDGRDVALSMRNASESWDASMGIGLPISLRAEAWRRQVENVRRHREWLGGRYMEIRYEQMRADTVGSLRRLFDFSQIRYSEPLLEEIQAGTQLSSYDARAAGSGFRGAGTGWRGAFSTRERIEFERAAGDLLTSLGYEREAPRWASLPRIALRRQRAADPSASPRL